MKSLRPKFDTNYRTLDHTTSWRHTAINEGHIGFFSSVLVSLFQCFPILSLPMRFRNSAPTRCLHDCCKASCSAMACSWVRIPFNPTSLVTGFIALFSLSMLLFQYRSHRDTLANSSFEISSSGSAHVRINYTHECINFEKNHSQGKIK